MHISYTLTHTYTIFSCMYDIILLRVTHCNIAYYTVDIACDIMLCIVQYLMKIQH